MENRHTIQSNYLGIMGTVDATSDNVKDEKDCIEKITNEYGDPELIKAVVNFYLTHRQTSTNKINIHLAIPKEYEGRSYNDKTGFSYQAPMFTKCTTYGQLYGMLQEIKNSEEKAKDAGSIFGLFAMMGACNNLYHLFACDKMIREFGLESLKSYDDIMLQCANELSSKGDHRYASYVKKLFLASGKLESAASKAESLLQEKNQKSDQLVSNTIVDAQQEDKVAQSNASPISNQIVENSKSASTVTVNNERSLQRIAQLSTQLEDTEDAMPSLNNEQKQEEKISSANELSPALDGYMAFFPKSGTDNNSYNPSSRVDSARDMISTMASVVNTFIPQSKL